MDPFTGALIAGGISGGISAVSGFLQQRRENKALEARKAWAQEEKIFNRKVFELETFQRFYSTEQAGAQRIFMASGLGGGTQGAQVLNQFDEFLLDRNLVLSEFEFQQQQRRVDQEIENYGLQKQAPWKRGLASLFTSGVATGVETYSFSGGFSDKNPNKNRKQS